MKRKLFKIVIYITAFILCFGSIGCDSCKNRKNNEKKIVKNEYILKDGITDYELLVPSTLSSTLQIGIDQFQKIFYEATGVHVNKKNDTNVDKASKYISVGQNTLFKESGLAVNDNLGISGFEIITNNNNIFIYGLNDTSTVYGLFEFLTQTVDFDCLIDGYYIKENVKEIPLYKFQITDIPDIQSRATNLKYITSDTVKTLMLRTESWNGKIMDVRGMSMHNVLYYLPIADYYEEHPEWYAPSKTQLSYTCNGDKESRNLMVQTVANVLKDELKSQPNKLYVKLSGSDDATYDECQAQIDANQLYGAESATAILFANDVIKIIYDWFETEEGAPYKRDFKILVSAYLRTAEAPVSYNEQTKQYEGNAGIKCADGVGIDYAPINIDYTHSIYDPVNLPYIESMKKWASITDSLFIWTYGTFAHEYFCPYDNYFYLQEMYQLQRDLGTVFEFNEVSDSGSAMDTCFGNYRMYLDMKLAWDCDQDVNELTKKFFNEYFGKLSDDMYEIFENMRVYLQFIKDHKDGYSGTMVNQNNVLFKDLWSKEFLLQENQDFTNAINKLSDYYVKGSAEYIKYYKRIALERLSPLYMLIELYESNTSAEQILAYKLQFKEDCILIGGGRGYCNGDPLMDEKYVTWGVA